MGLLLGEVPFLHPHLGPVRRFWDSLAHNEVNSRSLTPALNLGDKKGPWSPGSWVLQAQLSEHRSQPPFAVR